MVLFKKGPFFMSEENKSNNNEDLDTEVFDLSEAEEGDGESAPEKPEDDFKNQYLYLRAEFDNYKKKYD